MAEALRTDVSPVEVVLKRQRILVQPLPLLPTLLHKLSLHCETSLHVLSRHEHCISWNRLPLSMIRTHIYDRKARATTKHNGLQFWGIWQA